MSPGAVNRGRSHPPQEANPINTTFTVDPETITFTEWHDGEEVGSGDGRDIEALRETGELDPAVAALWDAMVSGLSFDEAA